ncbi:hypothetical protein LCL85_08900 [Vibrio alginolyticus]|nr:hypothetical protein [Vibrio alginolyticus]
MRIQFNDEAILSKNAKRTIEIIKALEINDPLFNEAVQKITLTKVKDALSVSYGYTNSADLKAHLSSEHPQLKDLTNDERLDLENAIMHSVGSCLTSLNVPPNVAYSVASAINEHLEIESGVKKKVERAQKFDTYKNIAKSYGFTIPALKKNLEATRALVGIFPTKKAIERNWCRVTIMESDSYGTKPRVLWNTDYVVKALKRRGISAPTPYQRFERPYSLHNAETNFNRLTESLLRLLTNNGVSNGDGDTPWEHRAQYVGIHPVAHFAVMNQSDRRGYLKSLFDDLLVAAKTVDSVEAGKIEASINKLIDWVVQY